MYGVAFVDWIDTVIYSGTGKSFYCIIADYGENMVLQEHMEQYECCIFRNIIKSRYCLNSFVLKIERMVLLEQGEQLEHKLKRYISL